MSVKRGVIANIERPPMGEIARVTITGGRLGGDERVYVALELLRQLPQELLTQDLADPSQSWTQLYFVERGAHGQTAWMGTWEQARVAVRTGVITADEAAEIGLNPTGDPLPPEELRALLMRELAGGASATKQGGCVVTCLAVVALAAGWMWHMQ